MKKIISLFQRNYETDHLVRDEVVPGAEWVLAGEGEATRKYDGICCMVRDGRLFRRMTTQQPGFTNPANGKARKPIVPPVDFEPATELDATTGRQEGWVPVGDGPADQHFRHTWDVQTAEAGLLPDGTYEFIGLHSQGNPERVTHDTFMPHGAIKLLDAPRTFDALRGFFIDKKREDGYGIEGIVWHHPDGRMVKIKARDFGFKRG